jgi:putative DNA primase/helicase
VVRASSSAGKGFLTRRHDKYRPPYGKHTINALRQCVFVGTINPPPNGYLKDPTGSRRFWPVYCHGKIDLDALVRDRDQLWAEAVVRYHEGAKWWLETPELEKLAEAEQAKRFAVDVWKPRIAKWIGGRTEVSAAEALKGALKIDPSTDHGALMRVIEVLKDLGFAKCRPRKGAKRGYCYRRRKPLQEPRTPRTGKARKTRKTRTR